MADTAVTTAVHDDTHAAGHGTTGLSNNKLAMWIFLGSECLLFGGLISTYMLYRGRVDRGPRPENIYDIPFTSVSSFVLLMSSLTMVLAVSAAHRADWSRSRADPASRSQRRAPTSALCPHERRGAGRRP